MPRRPSAVLLAGGALLSGLMSGLAGCAGGGSSPAVTVTRTPPAAASSIARAPDLSYELRYEGAVDLDQVRDTSGRSNTGKVRAGSGGAVDGEHEDGTAFDQQAQSFLRFPAGSCDQAKGCPQALIETSTPVNPGTDGRAAFSFGARVRLRGEPGEAGENVIERGRAVAGQPQWKLQVDHGQASCRWSDGKTVVLLPTDLGQSVDLEQGTWYDLRCSRSADGVFGLLVQDPRQGIVLADFTRSVPELGAIAPQGPVTVGAKRIGGPDAQTDQFRGDLDDIWFHTD